MAGDGFPPSTTAESKIDTPKAAFLFCLQLPGGDGGGFHVAMGKQGAIWNPATSRPGTFWGRSVRVLAFGLAFLLSASRMTTRERGAGNAFK
jgi:hypothetical protein